MIGTFLQSLVLETSKTKERKKSNREKSKNHQDLLKLKSLRSFKLNKLLAICSTPQKESRAKKSSIKLTCILPFGGVPHDGGTE